MEVMVDLETMGNGPQAAIVSIGAVAFDIQSGRIESRFYKAVDLESSVRSGGVIDPSTVEWWMAQSDPAKAALQSDKVHISSALQAFSTWLSEVGGGGVWGNGAAFDNVILASAYRNAGLPRPWPFWEDRCYRTIKNLCPDVPLQRQGTHHNALDDAETQAVHLISILSAKGLR